ncbi:MAG TPA: aminotransferase class V-fold PLP-dependent enzyme [Gaiellaceae bacterium]|nr:aminotransferase class V-fold PLP-dependent enzyme [Gaiellaceae bacterium]
MSATLLDVEAARRRFSSLAGGFTFLDAPGGSQVPDEVGAAIAAALRDASGNLGAPYETGRRVEEIVGRARADAARFLNCSPDDVVFGTNMTVLDFTLSRTASRDWKEGDRILVSRLDHDGGVAPWHELAADRGFELDWIDVTDDLRLDLDDLERKLDERVRVVACVASSNAVGTIVDIPRVAELAREAGALSWFDAVQYAAHEPVDVQALGCDVFIASAYKFCGPHLGVAYGRHDLLESWRPYKARPAASSPVGRRFEPGTAPYELFAGFSAAIAYLESLGGMGVLRAYEHELGRRFLDGLPDSVELYGLQTMEGRLPTFLLNVDGVPAKEVAHTLADRGYGIWHHDNWYSLGLREKLPYPEEAVRVGLIHYNTAEEIDGFLGELGRLSG